MDTTYNILLCLTVGAVTLLVVTVYFIRKAHTPLISPQEPEEERFPSTKKDYEQLLVSFTRNQEWIHKELPKYPIIVESRGFRRVFTTEKEYRDIVGWIRENIRIKGGIPDK